MTLIKTSLLNGIAVFIKMLTLLGINKLLAIYVGPAGYAALGQFQNAVQIITTFASGAINTGVIKYTAEYNGNEEKQRIVWRTAGTISLFGSVFTGLLVVLFSKALADWFLKDESYSGVFVWFGITLVLFTFNSLLLAILNGKKEIEFYVIANISGSLFALGVTGVLSITYGLYGALVSLAIYQSLSFFVTLSISTRASWFKLTDLIGQIDGQTTKNLAKYGAMALTSAACIPVTHILIRNHLGEVLGWEYAGYWEAIWRMSAAYLALVTTTLSVYYLPRLSELSDSSEIEKEILQGYKIILPIAAMCGVIVYLLRDFIITLLFTADFNKMEVLFGWQMIGDTLKIGSWVLAYLMLSKSMVKLFILTEIVFAVISYLLTIYLIDIMGFKGVAASHAITYFLYWIVMAYFIKSQLGLFKTGKYLV